MKRNFSSILILLLVAVSSVFGQDNVDEALKFYPLGIGDYWEYASYAWDDGTNSNISKPVYYSQEVIGSELKSNGKRYMVIKRQRFGEAFQPYYVYERVDAQTGKVYQYKDSPALNGNEFLLENLNASHFDISPSTRIGFGNADEQRTLSYGETTELILGHVLPTKSFEDQSTFPGLQYTLAQGIGFVKSSSCDRGCGKAVLVYANVAGKEFGNKLTIADETELTNESVEAFRLYQNYPNPFNPSTVISYELRDAGQISLEVYDMKGSRVRTLFRGRKEAGMHKTRFDAGDLPSGVYFYLLITPNQRIGKKMTLIK